MAEIDRHQFLEGIPPMRSPANSAIVPGISPDSAGRRFLYPDLDAKARQNPRESKKTQSAIVVSRAVRESSPFKTLPGTCPGFCTALVRSCLAWVALVYWRMMSERALGGGPSDED